jgi:hypothetical protein
MRINEPEVRKRIRPILDKLGLDTVGSAKVMAKRLEELSCEELRVLILGYECSINELAEKVWQCEGLKKSEKSL